MRTVPDPPASGLRSDARRNRDAILRAARRLMATHGLAVGHADIARAAGVGVGTVYRHFPEREDLIDALFAEHVEAVVDCAERARNTRSAWQGLQSFMTEHLALQEADRGLRELLHRANDRHDMARSATRRIAPIVSELVSRAHQEGDLVPGVSVGDFSLINLMIAGVMDAGASPNRQLWRRALDLALQGLHAGRPLLGEPPSSDLVNELLGDPARSP